MLRAMPLPPLSDTIAAIATARGAAAIGIVRLSGPRSMDIAARLFRPHSGRGTATLKPGTFSVGRFSVNGETVDEGLLLVFGEGRSYTGEQAVEMQVHGGSAVLRRLLDACLAEGARQAGPGEFTLRAYLSGRLDLAQAESVLAIIHAEGEMGRRIAATGLTGELSRRLDELQTKLTRVYASLQAQLDYPDEGVPEAEFREPLLAASDEIGKLLASAGAGRIASRGARLALAGRPNSGKSSLLNALLGFERSLVSDTPGTTRDYLEALLEIDGIPVTLVDTAGLRETDDEIESQGVAASRRIAGTADLVLVVLDPLQDSPDDPRTIALLEGIPVDRRLVIQSKADLSAKPVCDAVHLMLSSVTGSGVAELRAELAARLLGDVPDSGLWLSVERHAEALGKTLTLLNRALEVPEDLAALDLAEALDELASITGRTDVSAETLEHIFANFCVGK